MKKDVNPKLEVGDRVRLLSMNDPYSKVMPGSFGTVTGVVEVLGEPLYYMKWDNGSTLSLVPEVDLYFKVEEKKDNIQEEISDERKKKLFLLLNKSIGNKKFEFEFFITDQVFPNYVVSFYVHFNNIRPMIRVGEWYDYLECDLTIKITGPDQKLIDMFRTVMGEVEKGEPFDLKYRYKIEAGSLIAKETKGKFGMKDIYISKCKFEDTPLKESANMTPLQKNMSILKKNVKIFTHMDRKPIMKFLELLRQSGLTNMMGARPYLLMGKQGMTKELVYHKDGIEGYEELVEAAEDCKNEIIRGAMEILSSEEKDLELNSIERQVKRIMDSIMELYFTNYSLLRPK
jgi:hypothetical protein